MWAARQVTRNLRIRSPAMPRRSEVQEPARRQTHAEAIAQLRPPKYSFHKASGQAVTYVHEKCVYLGPYGEAKSLRLYQQLVERWKVAGTAAAAGTRKGELSVLELVHLFIVWAARRYVRAPQELSAFAVATKRLLRLHADTPVVRFGPLALQQVRSAMVLDGLTRSGVNAAVHRLRRIWRWGVSQELVHETYWNALKSVPALSEDEEDVRESEPVRPATWRQVRAVLQNAPQQVRKMVRVQILTGMRPGELVKLRPADLELSPHGWLYRPPKHKTKSKRKKRIIVIGPRAQKILAPLLGSDPAAFVFWPGHSCLDYCARPRKAGRRYEYTKLDQRRRRRRKLGARARRFAPHYSVAAYRRVVQRACEAVWPLPAELAREKGEPAKLWRARLGEEGLGQLAAWRKQHILHPHQLRHSFATRVGNRYGEEAAQKLLGHSRLATTEIYIERDIRAGRKIMAEVG
jgi:integrase